MEYQLYKNIVSNFEICAGRPTIKGTRLTVSNIMSFILAGDAAAEVLKAFPYLSEKDIETCKEFTTLLLENKHSMVELTPA